MSALRDTLTGLAFFGLASAALTVGGWVIQWAQASLDWNVLVRIGLIAVLGAALLIAARWVGRFLWEEADKL